MGNTKIIGTLDCETLSLSMNCVVYEVSLLVLEVDEYYTSKSLPALHEWRIEILEQVSRGRDISRETLDFQFKTFGTDFPSLVYGNNKNGVIPVRPLDFILDLKEKTKNLKELWINKTSFDSGRLHSLAEDFGVKGNLWPHRAELDIRTIRDALSLPSDKGDSSLSSAHRATADCLWNLGVLRQFGNFKRLDMHKKRKVIAKPKPNPNQT